MKSKPRKHKPNAKGYIQLKVSYIEPITEVARIKTIYGKTEEEAAEKKGAFLADVASGLRVAEAGMTVKQWSDRWLSLYKCGVATQTLVGYRCHLAKINAVIGTVQLKSVTQAHIMSVYASIRGMSASTIHHVKTLMRSMFNAAVDNRYIIANPATKAKAPNGSAGTHRALYTDEIKAILTVAEQGHRYTPVILLMLLCGLRRGEACAVHADDVLSNSSISITKSVTWHGNQPTLATPKTKAGIRVIPIPSVIAHYMRFEGYATGGDSLPTLMAFERGYASFMTAVAVVLNGCTKRWQPPGHQWREPNIRPHDLRHTYATLLYNAGVDIKTAQRWLGHSSPALTLRIYTHLTDDRQALSTDAFSVYFAANEDVQPNVQPGGAILGCTPTPKALAGANKKPPKSQ